MKTWKRRTLLVLSLLVAVIAVLSAVGVSLFRSVPDWYAPLTSPPEQRQKLAASAENKLIDAQNWAAELRADAVRAARAAEARTTQPGVRAAGSHVVEFDQDELNALFEKWSVLYGWGSKYRQFVEDPRVILRDGRLIIAGKMRDLRAIISLQFRPQIDPDGRLRLDLVKVTGGKLSLPDSLWNSYRKQLGFAVRRELPRWQMQARIAPTGAANTAAMAATMGRLFLQVAQHEPAEPILFLPIADHGDSVPVKLTAVEVSDGKLALAVEPLSAAERSALLVRIRSPIEVAQTERP